MNNIKQYYEILGLKPGALEAEVKQAYRHMAKTWHPDRFTDNPQLKQKAEEKIKKINEAYQKLKSYQANSPNQTSHTGIYSTHSSNAETYYRQGVENLKKERYKEAIEDFTQAIRLNPNYTEAYENRGLACSKLGYNHRADSDFQTARKLSLKQRKTESKPASPPSTSQPPSSKSPWKCLRTFTGHLDLVASVTISPDGQMLASGSFDRTIRLWQVDTGKVIHTLIGHSARVQCVAFSPDGQMLASSSFDQTIKLWHIENGECLRNLGDQFSGHSDEIGTVAFSPDGQRLVSGSRDKSIKAWHLATGQVLPTQMGHSDLVNSIDISPDGQILASGSFDKTVKI